MKGAGDLFLRAKHWQIFLLLVVVPTIAQFAAIGYMPTRIRSWRDFGIAGFVFLGAMELYLLCYLTWFRSMGLFLVSIEKPALRMKSAFFHFAFFYPAIYIVIFVFLISDPPAPAYAIVTPHLLCMFCLFYLIYFVSRSLVMIETGKPVPFSEYAVPFFLLWFSPLGVWIIQPKVNRLYAERRNAESFNGVRAG